MSVATKSNEEIISPSAETINVVHKSPIVSGRKSNWSQSSKHYFQ
jgi:hypothetical protein